MADRGEVPFYGVNVCPPAVLDLKERTSVGMSNSVAELLISLQLRDHAPGNRNDAALSVLGVSDGKGGAFGADILVIEPECFANPEAGHCDQAEQGRAGCTTQSGRRGQRRCGGHDPLDLRLAVDPWSWTCVAPWNQSFGWDFVTLINPLQPTCKTTHDAKPGAPCIRACRSERLLPAQEQFSRDPFGSLCIGKVNEWLEDEAG